MIEAVFAGLLYLFAEILGQGLFELPFHALFWGIDGSIASPRDAAIRQIQHRARIWLLAGGITCVTFFVAGWFQASWMLYLVAYISAVICFVPAAILGCTARAMSDKLKACPDTSSTDKQMERNRKNHQQRRKNPRD